MSSQPLYHLRPNKYIDRSLFVEALLKLAGLYNFSLYRYVGFGSYSFDDFKAIHCKLGISSMVSLEADEKIAKRADFNKPYKCIEIVQERSSDCLSQLTEYDSGQIVWLDYTSSKDIYSQFSDAITLLRRSQPGDVLRFTFNANPATLASSKDDLSEKELHETRFAVLKVRLEEYLDPKALPKDMNLKTYPRVLRNSLHYALNREVGAPNPYDTKRILPLFSTVYQDGQQMLTAAYIVVNSGQEEERIRILFDGWEIPCLEWDAEERIQIPYLTDREYWEVIRQLPAENGAESLLDKYPFIYNQLEDAESFVKFYRSYPRFHNVEV